ncbi:cytochrome c oxidase subunit 2A [Planococcus salinus]|uniref:Cytochrome c oxidase subunit 2A n=1 Tax=Planococcus salinus TaxID=1848460 RepID=A0A3M8PC33_9BACL|nr:cytochrome c oxidase subunit 2A [Planococcus salinus]RNF41193.1 cytochrome c oxidase subunit 2A [Planococcus salinus]
MKDSSSEGKKKEEQLTSQEASLKGTFVSVLIIAAFMLISWFSVFLLFLERN